MDTPLLVFEKIGWAQVKAASGFWILTSMLAEVGRGGLFYKAEVAFLERLGFKHQFGHYIEVGGKKTAVWE